MFYIYLNQTLDQCCSKYIAVYILSKLLFALFLINCGIWASSGFMSTSWFRSECHWKIFSADSYLVLPSLVRRDWVQLQFSLFYLPKHKVCSTDLWDSSKAKYYWTLSNYNSHPWFD